MFIFSICDAKGILFCLNILKLYSKQDLAKFPQVEAVALAIDATFILAKGGLQKAKNGGFLKQALHFPFILDNRQDESQGPIASIHKKKEVSQPCLPVLRGKHILLTTRVIYNLLGAKCCDLSFIMLFQIVHLT